MSLLFITVSVIILIALLLVLVILAQNSKGGGLSNQFGGSGTSQIIGVKKTGDLLEKVTWGLAIALLAVSLSTNFMIDKTPTGPVSPNVERAQEQRTLPTIPNSRIEGVEEGANTGEELPLETLEETNEAPAEE